MSANSDITPDQLAAVGRALYGERWQTSLATDLNVVDRTMRRWLAGDTSIPDGARDELRELLVSRAHEIDGLIQYSVNRLGRSDYFSSATLKEFDDKHSDITTNRQLIVKHYISRIYKDKRAQEYAMQGLSRRLEMLARCIDNVFRILPPDLAGLPASEALLDATINIQSFVFNVFGSIDNLAWIFVREKGLAKRNGSPIPPSSVGLTKKCTLIRGFLSTDFQQYIAGLDGWFDYLEDFRHALAHRIPLYIPPYVVSPNNQVAYRLAESRMAAATDVTEYERLSADQKALAAFVPCVMHSYEESAKPILFHSQMLIDFLTVEELAKRMLKELDP